jgi:hypothetical protein
MGALDLTAAAGDRIDAVVDDTRLAPYLVDNLTSGGR